MKKINNKKIISIVFCIIGYVIGGFTILYILVSNFIAKPLIAYTTFDEDRGFLMVNNIDNENNIGSYCAFYDGNIYFYKDEAIYIMPKSGGEEKFIITTGKILFLEVDESGITYYTDFNKKKEEYNYRKCDFDGNIINDGSIYAWNFIETYRCNPGIALAKPLGVIGDFKIDDEEYSIYWRPNYIAKPVNYPQKEEPITYLLQDYYYPVHRVLNDNTVIFIGKYYVNSTPKDYNLTDLNKERKRILSECLIKVDLEEPSSTILFSASRYYNIVYYNIEKEIVYVYTGTYGICLYDINTFEELGRYELKINKDSYYVFEACGDFLFVYDENKGYITRFNVVE